MGLLPCVRHCCRNQGSRSEQGMVLALVKLRFSRGSANPKQKLKKGQIKKKSMNCYQVLEKPSTFCLDFSECHLLPPIPAREISPWRQRTLPALSSLNSVTQALLTHNHIINTQLHSNFASQHTVEDINLLEVVGYAFTLNTVSPTLSGVLFERKWKAQFKPKEILKLIPR